MKLINFLVISLLLTSQCFAGSYHGVWKGQEWKQDKRILVADARPFTRVVTDMETGEQKITREVPTELFSCVQIDDGECVQPDPDHFFGTIEDVKK